MKKFSQIITFVITMLLAINVGAQITNGGSKRNWEQYALRYDTTYQETHSIAYPSTSTSSLRIGRITGQGLWAEPQLPYYPENGSKGTHGSGMKGGIDLGLYWSSNINEINKNLHPAIDLSLLYELGIEVYNYEAISEDPDYTVEDNLTVNGYAGFGGLVSLKPIFLINPANNNSNGVILEAGLILAAQTYYTSDIYYDHSILEYYGSISMEDAIGSRIDRTLQFGVRYKSIGLQFRLSKMVRYLNAPDYYHSLTLEDPSGYSFLSETHTEVFEENLEFDRKSISLTFHF